MTLKEEMIDMLEEDAAWAVAMTIKLNPAKSGDWYAAYNERAAMLLTAANLLRKSKSGK